MQEARARVASGEIGDVWNVHGGYLQDWLLLADRLELAARPDQGGALRAVADIGSHWLDLAQFVTGRGSRGVRRPRDVHPRAAAAAGAVETFARGRRRRARRARDDDRGRGAHPRALRRRRARLVVVSQVSAGRKNALRFEVDGSSGPLAWDAERTEELWLGHRDRPNETLLRNPALMAPAARDDAPAGRARRGLPGHVPELYRAVYRAVAAGEPGDPTTRRSATATSENVSATPSPRATVSERWVEVAP